MAALLAKPEDQAKALAAARAAYEQLNQKFAKHELAADGVREAILVFLGTLTRIAGERRDG